MRHDNARAMRDCKSLSLRPPLRGTVALATRQGNKFKDHTVTKSRMNPKVDIFLSGRGRWGGAAKKSGRKNLGN